MPIGLDGKQELGDRFAYPFRLDMPTTSRNTPSIDECEGFFSSRPIPYINVYTSANLTRPTIRFVLRKQGLLRLVNLCLPSSRFLSRKKGKCIMSRALAVVMGGMLWSICASYSQSEEEKGPKIVCPVSGQTVNKDCTVDYKGGKIAFCCGNCLATFKKDTGKFAAKANHQLAVTKQAKLVKCPFSGGAVNPDTVIEVAGAKVGFCCNKCKGKAELAEDRVALLFQDAAFAKGLRSEEARVVPFRSILLAGFAARASRQGMLFFICTRSHFPACRLPRRARQYWPGGHFLSTIAFLTTGVPLQ
jgi:hypothetical protein